MSSERLPIDAVLLLSFGGPEAPEHVRPFLEKVTAGRQIPAERLDEVEAQYALFGGISPINEECRRLRAALDAELQSSDCPLPVYWGNRNWEPLVEDTVCEMSRAGVRRAVVVATSAFSSYSGCRQYLEDLDRATAVAQERGYQPPLLEKVRPYWNHPGFIETVIANSAEAMAEVTAPPSAVRLVFTAHSIPLSMAATCDYEQQLREAARLVAAAVAPESGWDLVFQSRSGPPAVPWLEPDICDYLSAVDVPQEGRPKVAAVVVVPLGFVADHMEVKYDLDTRARAAAEAAGLQMARARTVGVAPTFVAALRELIEERSMGTTPRKVGDLPVRPTPCPVDCCRYTPRRPGS